MLVSWRVGKKALQIKNWLVMVSTQLKNISQNGNLPQNRGENKKYLKPPPRLEKIPEKVIQITETIENGLIHGT